MKKLNFKTNLSPLSSPFNAVFVVLSVLSTVFVVGCVPPKKDGPAQAKLVSVSEETSACEQKIKNQIEAKSLKLMTAASLETDIEKANGLFAALTETEYSAQQVRKEIQAVGIAFSQVSGDSAFSVEYEISKADKDTGALLGLSIVSEEIHKDSNIQISQEILVSTACELSVSQTSKIELVKKSSTEVTLLTTAVYTDGGRKVDSEKLTLKESEELLNFVPNYDDFTSIPKTGVVYLTGAGLGRYKVTETESTVAKEFGLDLVFNNLKLDIVISPESSLSLLFSQDKSKKISMTEVAKQKTWRIPREIWKDQILGSSENLNSFIESLLSKDYLNTHNSLILQANKAPAYDHFAAYWTIKSVTENNYILVENPNPVITAPVSALDLETNSTIQTDLPQIQKIAKDIAAKSNDRLTQIQMILDYLAKNYTYDYEMLKNNVVRTLTTEEALNRGTGVCQHYSVIFTAVARALKIPTRIVTGYFLDGPSAGAHAWVEAVIEDGKNGGDSKWRVIEPQSAKSLKQMYTRFYLPTVRARLLEDRDEGTAQNIGELLDIDYVLKPNLEP